MTVLIKGGTVISTTGADPAEVLVDGETIIALMSPGSDPAMAAERGAERVIDATGKYVIPGGVDVHTHMELPFGGTNASDDFETGTRAAAWGGTTTIIDFASQQTGENVRTCFDDRMALAEGNCAVDYGFHMIIGGVDDTSLKEMDILVREGVTSFKLFMAYPGVYLSDDAQILRAMQQCAGNGGMIMMHAENGIAIDLLAEQAVERGETAPVNHGLCVEPSSKAKQLTVPFSWPRLAPHRCTSCTCPPARHLNRWRLLGARAATCSPRRARNTCISRSRITLERRVSPVRVMSAVHRSVPNTNTTRPTCGMGFAPTT